MRSAYAVARAPGRARSLSDAVAVALGADRRVLEQDQQPAARGVRSEQRRQHGQGDSRLVAEPRDAAVAGVEDGRSPAPRRSAGNACGNSRECRGGERDTKALAPNCSIQGCSSGGHGLLGELAADPVGRLGHHDGPPVPQGRQRRATSEPAADDRDVRGDLPRGDRRGRPSPAAPRTGPPSPTLHPSRTGDDDDEPPRRITDASLRLAIKHAGPAETHFVDGRCLRRYITAIAVWMARSRTGGIESHVGHERLLVRRKATRGGSSTACPEPAVLRGSFWFSLAVTSLAPGTALPVFGVDLRRCLAGSSSRAGNFDATWPRFVLRLPVPEIGQAASSGRAGREIEAER